MEHKETSTEIQAEAADWVARSDLQPLKDAEKAEFQKWLSKDVRSRGAYMKAEAMLLAAEHALSDAIEPTETLSAAQAPHSRISRRQFAWLGGSAAVAASALGVVLVTPRDEPYVSYETAKGEVRLLPLADGSAATLNTESKIAVRYTKSRREVRLLQGEVLFAVAKNPSRPFTVEAGDTVVRAVGTSFVVRSLRNELTQVLVDEGAVDMFRKSSPADQLLRIPANARAVALDVPVPSVKLLDENLNPALVERRLSWRHGMLSFEGQTLKQAAAEFARYTAMPIVIDDPAIAELTVTGLFSAYDPVVFARSAAASLDLKVNETATSVMIWR